VVFETENILDFNGTTIALKYYGPCHTDCDISVNLANADVLFVGDTWWNGVYPFIDYSTGGSIDGMIRASEENLAKATDKTILVPGHGPAGHKAELVVFRDMLVAIRAKVAALKKQGHSLEEVIALNPTAAYDDQWGSLVPPPLFTEVVYATV
jgi:glyoxylase-like metal-dependent hydrolase (beta-lactamase superfamily II)